MANFTLTFTLVTICTFAADADRRTVAPVHTSRKLAGAIDLYLKEAEAAERAKAAAGEKLVATYEATIKRAMRGGDLRLVDELQAELKEVKGELDKGEGSAIATPDTTELRKRIVAKPWLLYWNMNRANPHAFTFLPDGTVLYKEWPKPGAWRIESRPALVVGSPINRGVEDVLFFLPNGELRGFFEGDGRPTAGFTRP